MKISLHSKELEFVIGISTDKAAQVSGVYGATKLLMESLFQNYEQMNDKVKYRIVRYGNVLYSTGSVLCKWKQLLQEGKDIVITEPTATRFYWTVDQAIQLIFDCLEKAENSNPYVPKMKAVSLDILSLAMKNKYGIWSFTPFENSITIENQSCWCKSEIKQIGLQKGENLHEKILQDGPDSSQCEQYTLYEIYEMI